MGTKEKYNALKSKHGLPEYDELNKEFLIEDIAPETDLLLQKVRIKIHEKLDYYSLILEALIQPDANLKDMYEAKYISDNFRADTYLVYKKIMKLVRGSEAISIDNTDEENIQYIKEASKEWNVIKKDVLKHLQKLKSLWEKETDVKEDLSYFG